MTTASRSLATTTLGRARSRLASPSYTTARDRTLTSRSPREPVSLNCALVMAYCWQEQEKSWRAEWQNCIQLKLSELSSSLSSPFCFLGFPEFHKESRGCSG